MCARRCVSEGAWLSGIQLMIIRSWVRFHSARCILNQDAYFSLLHSTCNLFRCSTQLANLVTFLSGWISLRTTWRLHVFVKCLVSCTLIPWAVCSVDPIIWNLRHRNRRKIICMCICACVLCDCMCRYSRWYKPMCWINICEGNTILWHYAKECFVVW